MTQSAIAVAKAAMVKADERRVKVYSLFAAIDTDNDNRLDKNEMYELAKLLEFEGSLEDFGEYYEGICDEHNCSPSEGLGKETFYDLVNKNPDGEGDWYIDDSDLPDFIIKALRNSSEVSKLVVTVSPSKGEHGEEAFACTGMGGNVIATVARKDKPLILNDIRAAVSTAASVHCSLVQLVSADGRSLDAPGDLHVAELISSSQAA